MNTRVVVQKACWRCGAVFACGPMGQNERCWCNAFPRVTPKADSDCLCAACLEAAHRGQAPRDALIEGEDYYREGSAIVFTAEHHLRRGYCCGSGCRHCPYGHSAVPRG